MHVQLILSLISLRLFVINLYFIWSIFSSEDEDSRNDIQDDNDNTVYWLYKTRTTQ